MCLFGLVCSKEEIELERKQATGACPYCKGKVQAVDFVCKWRFCFMPIGFIVKRKFLCTLCSRRLFLFSPWETD